MEDDDWSCLRVQGNKPPQQEMEQNNILHNNPILSNPFSNIVRIEVFFEQNIKPEGDEQHQKATRVQVGTGFLVGKNKVLTSASLLYSKQSKNIANYVLIYPESTNTKKEIKSKNIHINEHYKFQNPKQKFSNNFAIIFTEQNLTQSSAWQPYEFDWTYEQDYEGKENITVMGYRWKDSDKIYEKVFKQFKPKSKQVGVFKTKHKLAKGEQGSPLIMREKVSKDSSKILYKVVGILTMAEENFGNAIEFGYLVEEEDKQILKKETKTLGAQVLLSIYASKAYQDLKKQLQTAKEKLKAIKCSEPQQQVINSSDDISQMMMNSLAEKTNKLKQLEDQVKVYQEEFITIKKQKSAPLGHFQEINELNLTNLILKEQNEILNQKVLQLMQKADQLDIQKGKLAQLMQKENQIKNENERLKAVIVTKNIELTEKQIEIMTMQESFSNKNRLPPNQPTVQSLPILQSTSLSTSPPKPSTQPSPQLTQPLNQKPPPRTTQTQEMYQQQLQYIMQAFQTMQECKKRYHKHIPQQIQQVKTQWNITLDKQSYTLDHSMMLFNVVSFVKYEWENLELLDLSESGMDNMVWEDFASFGYVMPSLKVLIMVRNDISKIIPDELYLFPQLRILILDALKFTPAQKNTLRIYQSVRPTLKIMFK